MAPCRKKRKPTVGLRSDSNLDLLCNAAVQSAPHTTDETGKAAEFTSPATVYQESKNSGRYKRRVTAIQ